MYRSLLIESVSSQFISLQSSNERPPHDWEYLLLCASLLAQSDNPRFQDAALRIAQSCLELSDTSEIMRDAAATILDSLSNRPAIRLAEKRNYIRQNFEERLPFPLLQDHVRRTVQNTVSLSNDSFIVVNKFQQEFWKHATVKDWISVSAPTSAGKSYIIGRWIGEFLRGNPEANIVYVVPTRALIQQVERDLSDILIADNITGVSIVTLPLKSSLASSGGNVMVFTQERLHILLASRDLNIALHLLIVDEAQKIGDGYRGVLLQQAIEAAIHLSNSCKLIFASPMTDNPEVLLSDAPALASTVAIQREDITVNQNLLWATPKLSQPKKWNLELILADGPVLLGDVTLASAPSSMRKKFSLVAFAFGSPSGGNVIYVDGAAEAEFVAKNLYDLVGASSDCSTDIDIATLIDLIQKTVHEKYVLCNVLRRGIAFHYGNMPLLIRSEIEKLFGMNKIKFLVCTSTLIDGVNMPCQSIFVQGPTRGHRKAMSPSDFWNLAGRAGRWGKEFQGNVICIDARNAGTWKNGAPLGRSRFRISRTSDDVLAKGTDLLRFISGGTPRETAKNEPELEYVFSYLVSSYLRLGGTVSDDWTKRFPEDIVEILHDAIQSIVGELSTPSEIVLRNPGISPLAMDDLLGYFYDRTLRRGEPVEDLLPVPVESSNALDEYSKVLHRINKHLGDVFGPSKRVRQLALLIVDWMSGYPLARIISNRERYYGSDKLSALIRDTMKDVEEIARFQAPKYLTCYVDLLRYFLELLDRADLVRRLFDLNVLLEFGVAQKTQLSLIGLGLSRMAAISMSEVIMSDSLDEGQCLNWLQENNWMIEDLPELVKREVCECLALRTSRGG